MDNYTNLDILTFITLVAAFVYLLAYLSSETDNKFLRHLSAALFVATIALASIPRELHQPVPHFVTDQEVMTAEQVIDAIQADAK